MAGIVRSAPEGHSGDRSADAERCHDDDAASTFEPWQQLGSPGLHMGRNGGTAAQRLAMPCADDRGGKGHHREVCTARLPADLWARQRPCPEGPEPRPGMSSTGARSHGPTGHRPAETSYDRGSTAVRRQSSRAVATARPPRRRWAECRRGRTRKWADWAGRGPVLRGQPAQRWSTPLNASVLLRSLGHQPPGQWAYWAGFLRYHSFLRGGCQESCVVCSGRI